MHRAVVVRQRVSDERGMTLIELLVAMMIMSIVIVVFGSVLASVQRTAMKEDALGQANDQIRLAMEQIDHEMRSGNVMYDPSLENGSGAGAISSCSGCLPDYTMRIYTQTNADSRGQYECVLWQVVRKMRHPEDEVKISFVGKYVEFGDSYKSLNEALIHGGIANNLKVRIVYILVGASVTAVLFSIGNYVIGRYLGRTSPGSAFGAAGSLAVIMVWIYYVAYIIIFGAEVTRAYAQRQSLRKVQAAASEAASSDDSSPVAEPRRNEQKERSS
jgi:prepilin-type N-terminal cleavage/methylation domain-containing protein